MTASAAALRPRVPHVALSALWAFATVAVALGAARAVTTTYVPVLLERIADRPGLIGAVMLVNAVAGFVVPLAAGLWSDRRGTRAPFILGGALLAAGGLVAVALGSTSSYVVLALAAATVYVGLNAASTAHRALVAEGFGDDERAAATGAQEGAMLAGALAGTSSAARSSTARPPGSSCCGRSPCRCSPCRRSPGSAGPGCGRPPSPGRRAARRCACWPRSCAATVLGRCSSRRSCGSAPTPRSRPSWCSTPRTCSACARQGPGCCWPASAC